ncbi:VanZ family protein [Candidatus Gracilibacteria bacterium]|nr:VanZ family protein [Candidatus Gracilibacteria bacterium]
MFYIDTNVCFLIGVLLYVYFLHSWKKQNAPLKTIIWFSLLYLYILLLVSVTFFPVALSFDQEKVLGQWNLFGFWYDMQHYIARGMYIVPLKQTVGNLILLSPLGFLLPMIYGYPKNFANAFGVGFVVAFGIEFLQLFLMIILPGSYRIFDVDDLWLNTLGFVIGFFLYKIFVGLFPKISQKIKPE